MIQYIFSHVETEVKRLLMRQHQSFSIDKENASMQINTQALSSTMKK